MAGKLTDDKEMSASRLPGLMGFSKYSTPNDELQFSINAIDGKERPDIGNEAMGWGNTLEPVILIEAAKRLGLTDFDTQIGQAYTHRSFALSCSLDGIGYGLGQEITTDPDKGLYVIGQDSIVLSGPGVLEAKLTKTMPEDVPHLARGPIQLQGQMLVTGHKWGAVCVLYQGIELRVFLFAPHYDTQKEIIKAVMAFEHKLQTYRDSGSIDWYPPASSKELDRIYPMAATKEEVELDGSVADLAQAIVNNKAAIRAAEAGIEEAEKQIKSVLGQAERGRAGQYLISWPMRNYKAQSERLIPAKEPYSVRQSTLSIKELQQ
ncbi:YqaJ viral recombinase [uncultured Caudovirales phage]|uniref:YqaJ viral recombinase n=1 Tax=uncultured Caudovirales phage TaxID=2100421 RepID=A0A6J5N385_9CAUD|nr:YqaJ viral recombinase [uncultured Caudovirales phage]